LRERLRPLVRRVMVTSLQNGLTCPFGAVGQTGATDRRTKPSNRVGTAARTASTVGT